MRSLGRVGSTAPSKESVTVAIGIAKRERNGVSSEGDARCFLGFLVTIKSTAETTNGRVAVVEHLGTKGLGSPLRVHRNEDEWFYVTEGKLTFWVGGETINAPAGSFIYGPRDVPHTFSVSSERARFLLVTDRLEQAPVTLSDSHLPATRWSSGRDHGEPVRLSSSRDLKYWRGDFVTVFPERRWEFHRCILCNASIKFGTKASKTGIGTECARRTPAADADRLRDEILERDRQKYRREVLDLGFRIER